jgi:LysM repeat protein
MAGIVGTHGRRGIDARGRTPVRLTRRGRVAVFVALLAAAAAGLIGVSTAGVAADAGKARPVVVVQPGDTLWEIAVRTRPTGDPFATVEAIRELNGLPGYTIHPGQKLRVPGRG